MFERIATGPGLRNEVCSHARAASRTRRPAIPNRPVTMVVPLPAGGTADLLCRFAAERRGGLLGQQVVIENRAGGAGGRVGTRSVLRSPPDGYTRPVRAPAHLQHHRIWCSPRRHSTPRAMEPISVLATYPLIVLATARPAGQQHAGARRLCAGQSRQGQLRSSGQGQYRAPLGRAADAQGQFPHDGDPYRGQRPAINDLLAGNIDIVPDYLLANKQNIDAGKLKFLATGSRERLKDYPNVATLAETLPGVYADTWMGGGGASRNAEGDRQEDIGRDRTGVPACPICARAFCALEAEPLGSTPEQMREHHQGEHGTMGPGGRGRQDRRRLNTKRLGEEHVMVLSCIGGSRRRFARGCIGAGLALAAMLAALPRAGAQDYPSRPVKIIVPFPAGGTADVMPRVIGEWLSRKWGQPVVVENRTGAAGNIGAEAVAKAEPDGYTLLSAPPPPLVINQNLYPKLGFDPTEFVPIVIMGRVPNALVVNAEAAAQQRRGADRLRQGAIPASSPPPPRATARHRISPPNCSS